MDQQRQLFRLLPRSTSALPAGRVRRPRAPRVVERRSRRHQSPAAAASSLDLRLENLTEGMEVTVGQEQGVHHMMLRLTERRRSRGEERSLRRLRDQDVVAFRRALYRTGIRVRSGGWDSGRQRDVSAAHLRRNPACLRRLLPWLQRELTVLYGSHGSLVSIVQHIIMSRITHYDMDDAAIRDELRPFLLARTDHFLHELVSFARSTLSIEAYDQQAVYECPAPSYEEDSGSDSSIIAISEDDDSEEADITEATEERVPPVPMATGGESSLSQSGWDDETPGPSYSTLFPSPSQSQADGAEPSGDVAQADEVGRTSGADGPREDEEEECMIVGYVKPMAERTPELVQLSSDSSEEEQEAVATEMATAATVPKAEASSSQAQATLSPESYRRPLSPSSCPYPSASRSPGLNTDRVSPQNANSRRSHSGERDAETRSSLGTKEETRRRCFRDGSQSCSDSSVLSGTSGHSRSCRRSGSCSRHQERSTQRELQRWSCPSSGLSPTVSVASDSSNSSPSWEQPRSRDRKCPGKSDEEQEHPRSVSVREKSSQSSICWDSPVHGSEQKKARKRRRHEKERERSRSPLRDYSASHGSCRDSRRRHGRRERRLRAANCSSSRSSSSSEDSQPDRPCPEKPAGKRKYKTRHLERAAQRQSSRRSSRDRERQEARSSPAKRHHRGDRERSRSPSVEIIFERRASDLPSHTHRWKRKRHKRRSRREARPLNSPTIITIESDSDTNDYQDCVTEVTNRTADSQRHEVTSSRIRYQGRVIKAAVCKTDNQPCTDVTRTTEDQHLVAKVTNGTTDDHSVTNSTSDAQRHVTKITDDLCRATVVVDRTADLQNHVPKVPESKTDDCSAVELPKSQHDQNRVNNVTDNCRRSVVDVPDHAVDCQDGVVKSRDPVPETPNSKIDSRLSSSAALPGSSLESYSPATPTQCLLDSPDCALNLEKCVVDVVDPESFDHSQQSTDPEQPGGIDDLSQDASLTTATPPSDTRLLESILQELEDILPEERQEAEPRQGFAATDNGVDRLEDRIVPPRDQSEAEREGTGSTDS
ncbi:hypothetical protein MHYP_G00088430 [Metynnis hypsauchen]